MISLSNKSLASLRDTVRTPAYARADLRAGIVHLGIGAFHRAHQAVYTEAALADGDRDWGIVGVSLRSADTRDALREQDWLYTVNVRGAEGDSLQVVGALNEILVAPENPEAVLARLCDPRVRVVSLTVTEKGYCHDPASGDLQSSHPDIVHDLAEPRRPRSAPGFLVEALARRQAAGTQPFTVLCCDNLPANGETAQRVVTQFASCRDPSLARYIEHAVAFPSTMVDRIVPATTEDDRARVATALGLADRWPVVTEPFSQWVLEDHFPSGRPRWELQGAQFVGDVAPYETMKLRLLNGSHSAIAYLGYLAGYETVAEAMDHAALACFVEDMMAREVAPTLPPAHGADLGAYQQALLRRFRNPTLRHRTWQIAMDGTQKLPQRILNTIRERRRDGAPFDRLALVVAGWMQYASGRDLANRPIDVRDPLTRELQRLARGKERDPAALAQGMLAMTEVFGHDLPQDAAFRERVTAQLASLARNGVAGTLGAIATMPQSG